MREGSGAIDRPSPLVALLRGITKRSPRCGLVLEREEGAFLGSLSLNYAVTGVVFMAVLVTWVAVQTPHVRWLPLALVSVAVAVVVPFLFYPFAKTIWAAIDYLLHGMDVGEDLRDATGPNAAPGTPADRTG